MTELWDRCGEVAAARVKYVLAYHRRQQSADADKAGHEDVKRRYRWADPEKLMIGVPEWEEYHKAERAALQDKYAPSAIKAIQTTSYVLFDAIGTRRTEARK